MLAIGDDDRVACASSPALTFHRLALLDGEPMRFYSPEALLEYPHLAYG